MFTGNSRSMDREEELALVEAKLREAEDTASYWVEKARALRGRTNTLRPISRISLEILQMIFLLLFNDTNLLSGSFVPRWDWVCVTWVCRYWREAAIGFPKLWTVISNFKHTNRIRTYLERSRDMQIKVHLGRRPSAPDELPAGSSNLLGIQIERITDLALRFGGSSSEYDLLTMIFARDSLPYLKQLQLSNGCQHTSFIETRDAHRPVMHLKSLYLRNLLVPWDHDILKGLSELHLEGIDKLLQPSLPSLLAVLDGCPRLRVLMLIDAGPKFSFQQDLDDSEVLIDLPYLRYIKIGAVSLRMCEALLSSLDYSARMIWDITITDFPLDDFIEPMQPDVLNLDSWHEHVTLTIENDRLSSHGTVFKDKPPTNLTLLMDYEKIINGQAFRGLSSILYSEFWVGARAITVIVAVTGIRSSERNFITMDAWDRFFSEIDMHENLTLSFPSHKGLESNCIQAFSRITRSLTHDGDESFIECPDLEVLRVEKANFDIDWNDEEDIFQILVENVKVRNQKDRRLKKLSFIGCSGITEEDINDLRDLNVCDEIYWEI